MDLQIRAEYDYLFKLILIGDAGVGKSSLLSRFTDDHFTESYISTIGIDFKVRTLELVGERIKLQLWDASGQKRFETVVSAYYRGCQGFILVYDISDQKSFENIKKMLQDIVEFNGEEAIKLLVGNKSDLFATREVNYETAEKFANQLGIPFIETSAKDAINVEEAFFKIACDVKSHMEKLPTTE